MQSLVKELSRLLVHRGSSVLTFFAEEMVGALKAPHIFSAKNGRV